MHGHDSGMLQLPGDARLLQESRLGGRVVLLLGSQLLQGHVAAQVSVPGEPDLANAAGGMQAGQRVAPAALGVVRRRRAQRGQLGEGLGLESGGFGPAADEI
jgi:hypothetical protein